MKVLGLNVSIDSSAALVVEGRLVAAACQERFDRVKHSRAFPAEAMAWCLAHAGLTFDDIDRVAFFWNPALQLDGLPGAWLGPYRHHAEYLLQLPAQLARSVSLAGSRQTRIEIDRGPGHRPLEIVMVAHHLCHASLAWRLSGFETAGLLSLDGYGERVSGVLGRVGPAGIEVASSMAFPHSLGSVYAAVTEFLGFPPNAGEGTVMGLAAHGRPRFRAALDALVRPTADGVDVALEAFSYYLPRASRVGPAFLDRFGPPHPPGAPPGDRERDLAASLQDLLADHVVRLAGVVHERTGEPRLVYAGGVALNSAANGRLRDAGPFEAVFVPPAAGDAGTAAGAALYVDGRLGGDPGAAPAIDALGPDVPGDAELEPLLRRSGYDVRRPDDLPAAVADRLAVGAILGWYQGRMEYGPRALGQRSILADPRRIASRERLDARIKHREPFRPYAPAVTREALGRYFAPDVDCPFMLTVLDVRPEVRAAIPAVVHVDGSARVQSVESATQPLFHALLVALEARTGHPIVLNTSFNGRGQPIVARPEQALAMLATTDLDGLVIGPFVVDKRRVGPAQ